MPTVMQERAGRLPEGETDSNELILHDRSVSFIQGRNGPGYFPAIFRAGLDRVEDAGLPFAVSVPAGTGR